MLEDLTVAHPLLGGKAHRAALAHAHAVTIAVVGHHGGAIGVGAKIKAVTGAHKLADVAVAAAIGDERVVLHKTAQILVGCRR